MIAEVYFNLHKKCLSVRDAKTRLVIRHTELIRLANCQFKVSEAVRQRVLRERRKNVHALVKGSPSCIGPDTQLALRYPSDMQALGYCRATYNPYKYCTFVDLETLEPVLTAREVIIQGRTIWYLPSGEHYV